MRSAGPGLLALLLTAGAAGAQIRLDLDLGHAVARAWCATCHAVEPGQRVGPLRHVPSFSDIAHQPSTTADSLRAFLSTAHRGMPRTRLDAAEVEEVIRYILRLKEES